MFGEGPVDLVFVTQWGTNIDNYWDEPTAARYLDRLASFSRVILFDKRGTGVSDHVTMDDLPPMDAWMEDILAVMDAAESERAVIVGDTEGAAMAILFAATYPERTVSLVLVNAIARLFRGPDYPIGMPQHLIAEAAGMFRSQHGTTGAVLDFTAPSVANDERFRRWWVKFQRSTMPPGSVEFLYEWQQHVDVTSALSSVNVPTLVIHRKDNVYHRVAHGKWIADRIDGSLWVELEGADSHPFHVGNTGEILDRIEDFVTGEVVHTESGRRLATVLFTDIVGSTERVAEMGDETWLDVLDATNRICERQIERFGGTGITTKQRGSGSLGPLRGSLAIYSSARRRAQSGTRCVARIGHRPRRLRLALTNCPECDDRVSSASPECPNCGHVLVDTSEAIPQEPKTHDGAPSRVSSADSGALPRSQSNWVVGLAIAAITGVILIGVAAAVVLAGSISISNPFEDTGAVGVSATETTETSEATIAPPDDDDYGLLVGDCINDDELESYIAGDNYQTTPCDGPHGNEVYLVHGFPPGSYPGEDAVREDLLLICESEFDGYVGRDYESSSLDVYVTWPGSDLWASGVRIGECLLYDRDLDDLTGSAYQSGW